jgi:hypothetical protein
MVYGKRYIELHTDIYICCRKRYIELHTDIYI